MMNVTYMHAIVVVQAKMNALLVSSYILRVKNLFALTLPPKTKQAQDYTVEISDINLGSSIA